MITIQAKTFFTSTVSYADNRKAFTAFIHIFGTAHFPVLNQSPPPRYDDEKLYGLMTDTGLQLLVAEECYNITLIAGALVAIHTLTKQNPSTVSFVLVILYLKTSLISNFQSAIYFFPYLCASSTQMCLFFSSLWTWISSIIITAI